MMPSRGMGAIKSSKHPKTIRRKDNPDVVEVYKRGGLSKARKSLSRG